MRELDNLLLSSSCGESGLHGLATLFACLQADYLADFFPTLGRTGIRRWRKQEMGKRDTVIQDLEGGNEAISRAQERQTWHSDQKALRGNSRQG